MRLVKILLILTLISPALFVMGTIASVAQTLEPFSIGSYNVPTGKIAAAGEALQSATRGITFREIDLLRGLIKDISSRCDKRTIDEGLYRIRLFTSRSV